MTLSSQQISEIENKIRKSLIDKLGKYKPETNHMPFHYRLLGKDRMALFSFIHSLNTSFGTSIFEPVAESIASHKFRYSCKQFIAGDEISEQAQSEIQSIIDDLSIGINANATTEIERIRKVCRSGKMKKTNPVKVDLLLQDYSDGIHLFDLKTAKPNKSSFKDFKRTLLEWIAIYLAKHDENTSINSYIAIPYNPYYPKPYERWTMKGMLDLNNQLKVDSEFWDFLGGDKTYEKLLNCFEKVGSELRPEIDAYFSQYKQ